MHSGHVRERGGTYAAVERALWALGPALLMLALISLPWTWAQRQQAALELSQQSVAENQEYCAKWGMPPGSDKYDGCARDLADIRGRAELRMRDDVADDF